MIRFPKISSVLQKKHQGQVAISWNGKVLGYGKDSVQALEKAKKEMSDIEEKEFLVFRVHHDEILAV